MRSVIPLDMIGVGENASVLKVGGKEEVKSYLGSLGFVPGTSLSVVSENRGCLIVNIKDSRIAINKDIAKNILV